MQFFKLGETAALATAVCWTVSAMTFEAAGKKVGAHAVNWLKLCLAFIFLSICSLLTRGIVFPVEASTHTIFSLSCSGMVGFVLGDFFLFQAYVMIGARISLLIMSLSPPLTALISWLVTGEKLSWTDWGGMSLTVFGIAMVILKRNPSQKMHTTEIKLKHPLSGILLAFGGALGQSGGLVLSKYGIGKLNAFAATQIRVTAGVIGFTLLLTVLKAWPQVKTALKSAGVFTQITIGSVFGPFLGVSAALLALQYTSAGVASTVMSIIPILIIPPSVIFLKEKISFKEILGAVIVVTGIALLFLY